MNARSRVRPALFAAFTLLAGCSKDTPTEPDLHFSPHVSTSFAPNGSGLYCYASLSGESFPDAPPVITWFASDPSAGAFQYFPTRFVPAHSGEVALWAHAEFRHHTVPYSMDSDRQSFVFDVSGSPQYVGFLAGHVTEAGTGRTKGIIGAEVRILDGYGQGKRTPTLTGGYYRLDGFLVNQTFTVTTSAAGYQSQTMSISFQEVVGSLDFELNPLP